jgi:hypothetical protein
VEKDTAPVEGKKFHPHVLVVVGVQVVEVPDVTGAHTELL